MRDDLVGYLMGALDAPDRERVEAKLADPSAASLRHEMDLLRRAMTPLAADRDPLPAPPGLAARTLRSLRSSAAHDRPRPTLERSPAAESPRAHGGGHGHRGERVRRPAARGPASPVEERSEWGVESAATWIDKAILAATALAASILLFPALAALVEQSRTSQTERKLGKIGQALHGYASSHRRFPSPPDGGPLSRGGLYAPLLVSEHRLVADDGTFLAPGTALARSGTFRVPTIHALEAAKDTPSFEELVRSMGGDFGYTLGHRDAMGRLQPIRGLHRRHHPLMADAPDESGERSDNHPDGIHHILWEDGRVERVEESGLHVDDHLFRNHDGVTAAGKDEEDAVIGDSHHRP